MQWLPEELKTKFTSPEAMILNERERQQQGQPIIAVIHYHAMRPLDLSNHIGSHVEICMPVEEAQRAARNFKKRHMWGDQVYTADTDLFAALVHRAFLAAKCVDPAFQWPQAITHLRCIVRVLPPQGGYGGCLRNGVRTRAWPSKCHEFAYSIVRAWLTLRAVRFAHLAVSCSAAHADPRSRCLLMRCCWTTRRNAAAPGHDCLRDVWQPCACQSYSLSSPAQLSSS